MPAVIFSGTKVKALKQNLSLNNVADFITTTSDPTSVAFSANRGSLILRDAGSSGELYIKQNNGSSTSWDRVTTIPLANGLYLRLDGSNQMAGNLLFSAETFNIGADGANRPDNIFIKSRAVVGTDTNGLINSLALKRAASYTAMSVWNDTGDATMAVGTGSYTGDARYGYVNYSIPDNRFNLYAGTGAAIFRIEAGGATTPIQFYLNGAERWRIGSFGQILHTGGTMSGTAPTYYKMTGTLGNVASQDNTGMFLDYDTADSAGSDVLGAHIRLKAGITGATRTRALTVNNSSGSTDPFDLNPSGSIGLYTYASGSAATSLVSIYAEVQKGRGIVTHVSSPTGSDLTTGITGFAAKGPSATTTVGGYFRIGSDGFDFNAALNANAKAALIADNSDLAEDIVKFRDNGSDVFRVQDRGFVSSSISVPDISAQYRGFDLFLTTTGLTQPTRIIGHRVEIGSGYTGSGSTRAIEINNNASGSQTLNFGNPDGNFGIALFMGGATEQAGILSQAYVGTKAWGLVGQGISNDSSAQNVGTSGLASISTAGSPKAIGGYFRISSNSGKTSLYSTDLSSFSSAALIASNGDTDAAIAEFYDNTTSVWRFTDGGHFVASTDGGVDIGRSGVNRPNNVFIKTSILVSGRTDTTFGISGDFQTLGTNAGTTINFGSLSSGNVGVRGESTGSHLTGGYNIGTIGRARNASHNIGVAGIAQGDGVTSNIGVFGMSPSNSGPSTMTGGWFLFGLGTSSTIPTAPGVSAALIAESLHPNVPALYVKHEGLATFLVTGELAMQNDRFITFYGTTGGRIGRSTTVGRPSNVYIKNSVEVGNGITFSEPVGKFNGTFADQVGHHNALEVVVVSSGTLASSQVAIKGEIGAGYTGSRRTTAGQFTTLGAATGYNNGNPDGNMGVYGSASPSGGIAGIGVYGEAYLGGGGSVGIGVEGFASGGSGADKHIGVVGKGNTATATTHIGGYFAVGSNQSGDVYGTASAGLIANNGDSTHDIFKAQDNGTDVWRIIDGGNLLAGTNGAVTIGADGANSPSSVFATSSFKINDGTSFGSLSFTNGIGFDFTQAGFRSVFSFTGNAAGGTWKSQAVTVGGGDFEFNHDTSASGYRIKLYGSNAHIFWDTDGGGKIGDTSANRPSTINTTSDITAGGNLIANVAGKGLRVKEGTNARMGVATLVAGTVTVSNTSITANTRIFLTHQNNSGVVGFVTVSARNPGTDFTITSSSSADTSDIAWILVEPA